MGKLADFLRIGNATMPCNLKDLDATLRIDKHSQESELYFMDKYYKVRMMLVGNVYGIDDKLFVQVEVKDGEGLVG